MLLLGLNVPLIVVECRRVGQSMGVWVLRAVQTFRSGINDVEIILGKQKIAIAVIILLSLPMEGCLG